jgi:site-specific recombinase XerD
MMVGRLLWFLDDRKYKECGTPELEDFFAHLTFGHEEPGGRWNMGGEHLSFRAMQPVTILGYYRHLAVLFEYLVMKGHLDVSPFRTIGVPEAHSDQIIPFTDHEVQAMLDAAKRRGMHKNAPKYNSPVLIARNQAIILFLVSSGVRASELCGLKLGDIDLTGRRAVVTGKGNKRRVVPFSDNAETALRRYLNARYPNPQERQPGDALFASEGTCSTSDFMNRQSLRQLISKIGKAAGLSIPKCSTHTFRHTFALRCAENGWDVLRLKEVMGHTNIKTTMIYINLAQSTAPLLEGAYLPGNDLRI